MTKLSLPGKLLGAAVLVSVCLLTTGATALSGGQAPSEKRVQIKIIVDGKEIDLGDPQLLNYIEQAQRKMGAKAPAAGKTGANNSDVTVRIWDAASGKAVTTKPGADAGWIITGDRVALSGTGAKKGQVIWAVDPADMQVIRFTADQPATGQKQAGDPRIDELVKQAEAIKPGSGAAIRKALQAAPKRGAADARFILGNVVETKPNEPLNVKVQTGTSGVPARAGQAVETKPLNVYVQGATSSVPARAGQPAGDKKIIILSIEDGKVIQLNAPELKRAIEKNIRIEVDGPKGASNKDTKKAVKVIADVLVENPKAKTPATKTERKSAPDVEALRRQLERISAELRDLQDRLDRQRQDGTKK
jgi:hypothetical protein